MGPQLGGAGPVAEKGELLLDSIFHLPAGAVELLVERLRSHPFGTQRGHHKTRVFAFVQVLSFSNHASAAAPRFACPLGELRKQAGGLVCLRVQRAGLFPLGIDQLAQSCIPR
jgi:hypothetical protein